MEIVLRVPVFLRSTCHQQRGRETRSADSSDGKEKVRLEAEPSLATEAVVREGKNVSFVRKAWERTSTDVEDGSRRKNTAGAVTRLQGFISLCEGFFCAGGPNKDSEILGLKRYTTVQSQYDIGWEPSRLDEKV